MNTFGPHKIYLGTIFFYLFSYKPIVLLHQWVQIGKASTIERTSVNSFRHRACLKWLTTSLMKRIIRRGCPPKYNEIKLKKEEWDLGNEKSVACTIKGFAEVRVHNINLTSRQARIQGGQGVMTPPKATGLPNLFN